MSRLGLRGLGRWGSDGRPSGQAGGTGGRPDRTSSWRLSEPRTAACFVFPAADLPCFRRAGGTGSEDKGTCEEDPSAPTVCVRGRLADDPPTREADDGVAAAAAGEGDANGPPKCSQSSPPVSIGPSFRKPSGLRHPPVAACVSFGRDNISSDRPGEKQSSEGVVTHERSINWPTRPTEERLSELHRIPSPAWFRMLNPISCPPDPSLGCCFDRL